MATKTLIVDSLFTGRTVYYTCKRLSDGYALLSADGTFAAPPATIANGCLSMTESGTVPGRYSASEARTVWTDGRYEVFAYSQNGGTPNPLSDGALGYGTLIVVGDAEDELLQGMTAAQNTMLVTTIPAAIAALPTAAQIIAADDAAIIEGTFTRLQVRIKQLAILLGLDSRPIATAANPNGDGAYSVHSPVTGDIEIAGTIVNGVRTVTTPPSQVP